MCASGRAKWLSAFYSPGLVLSFLPWPPLALRPAWLLRSWTGSNFSQMAKGAITVRDVAADEFVVAFSAHLKKAGNLPVPKWTTFCKTATHKELAPYNQDWYYVRAGECSLSSSLRLLSLPWAVRHGPRARWDGPNGRGMVSVGSVW